MKNIHLLPTEKPSRLFKFANKLHLDNIPKDYYKKYSIYITSNEEVKAGDWCYDKLLNFIFKTDNYTNFNYVNQSDNVFKIILTTDQELNGVQAIDDEFLEWFIKNPKCEIIEVKHFGTCCGNQSITQCINCEKYNPIYKIIIPQEETKK
jgi:hypothetical protein